MSKKLNGVISLNPEDEQEDHAWRDEVLTMITAVRPTWSLSPYHLPFTLLCNEKTSPGNLAFEVAITITYGPGAKKLEIKILCDIKLLILYKYV